MRKRLSRKGESGSGLQDLGGVEITTCAARKPEMHFCDVRRVREVIRLQRKSGRSADSVGHRVSVAIDIIHMNPHSLRHLAVGVVAKVIAISAEIERPAPGFCRGILQ